jgi:hypothetical protein
VPPVELSGLIFFLKKYYCVAFPTQSVAWGWVCSRKMGFFADKSNHAHKIYPISLSWKLKETPFCTPSEPSHWNFGLLRKKKYLEFWTVIWFRVSLSFFLNLSAFWCCLEPWSFVICAQEKGSVFSYLTTKMSLPFLASSW